MVGHSPANSNIGMDQESPEPAPPTQGEPARKSSGGPELSNLPPGLWPKVKHLVTHNVLHLDDTPHRIAFGVFLGFVVGATPTIGLQMLIYVAIAAVLGANKVSGILPVWLSNPITAVPLYYTNWRIGQFLTGGSADDAASQKMLEALAGLSGQDQPLWQRVVSPDFWKAAIDAFVALGVELWLGSLVVGVVLGIPAYWVTYRGVIAFRKRRAPQG